MKLSEKCPCCGHIETAYTHVLNVSLVKALRQIVEFYETFYKPANLQKDLDLTKNQYNNFQKLQYFHLVYKIKGGWEPSTYGRNFIYGEIPSYKRVTMFKKEFKTAQDPVYVSEIDETSYKKREEYKAEKANPDTLFNCQVQR